MVEGYVVLQAKTFFTQGIAAEQRGNHYQGSMSMSLLPPSQSL